MATNVIVSYDATDNDHDALMLGRVLADAGARLTLAYVRHTTQSERTREELEEHEAEALLERGASSCSARTTALPPVISRRSALRSCCSRAVPPRSRSHPPTIAPSFGRSSHGSECSRLPATMPRSRPHASLRIPSARA